MKFASSLTAAIVAASFTLAGSITACSSDDSGTGSTSSSSSSSSSGGAQVGDLNVTSYINARCTSLNLCFPGLITAFYGDVAGCESALTATTANLKLLNGESVTQAQLDACAAKTAAITSCDENQVIEECQFAGTLADGSPCSEDAQCSGRSCGKPASGGTCGTCQKLGAEGDACSGTKPCDDALELECQNDVCTKAIPKDGVCTFAGLGCQSGLKCNNNKCEPALKLNDPCDTDGDACGFNLHCEGGAGDAKCVGTPAVTFANLGEPCGQQDANNQAVECKASYCDASKKCVAFLKLGDTCTTDNFGCGGSLECDPTTLKCVDTSTASCK